MIHAALNSRGLESLRDVLWRLPGHLNDEHQHICDGTIAFPDFICDEVLARILVHFPPDALRPYHVRADLRSEPSAGGGCDALYTIDYFGRESEIERFGFPVIRDAVWMPYPERELTKHDYWFNSFRKFAWPAYGSLLLSHAEWVESDIPEGTDAASVRSAMGANGITERRARHYRFDVLDEKLNQHGVEGFAPQFPSVYPLIVPNRDAALARLVAQGIRLPGMWKNAYNLPNDLYRTLMLVPCDSRFSVEEIERRADLVLEAIKAAQ